MTNEARRAVMDRLSEIEERLTRRTALPCSDCDDDFTCGCCVVDQEMAALVAAVREVEVLHRPHPDGGQGYDAVGEYVWFDQVCQTCGQYDEYAVAWPCPTAAAVQKLGEGS